MVYDEKGNITHKKAVGVYGYNNNRPYAVDLISTGEGENQVLERIQDITYNAMMRPASISEGGKTTNFFYDGDGVRIKMQIKQGDQEELSRYYIGAQYEYDITPTGTEERLYLDGDAYEAPAVFVKKNKKEYLYYVGRDYLGSITHVLDEDGNLLQELSYDAWGRLRNPENHELYAQGSEVTPILGGRGYTGHEHLTHYGLINMNARLYDPVVGRFLSPDPYVQAPDFSQNFNRYSYALNNPLLYTDPNGEFIHIVLGAFFGGIYNVITHWGDITKNGFNLGKFASYAAIGTLSGAGYAAGGFIAGVAITAAMSAANQFVENDYEFSSDMVKGMAIETISFVATAGLTKGLPGNKGLGLNTKISSWLNKLGLNKYISYKAGNFTVNYITSAGTYITSDLVLNDGNIRWSANFQDAFWSASFSLGLDFAAEKLIFKYDKTTSSPIPEIVESPISPLPSQQSPESLPANTPKPNKYIQKNRVPKPQNMNAYNSRPKISNQALQKFNNYNRK